MSLPRVLTVGQPGQLEMHPAVEVEKLRGPVERATLKADAPFRQRLATLRRELRLKIGLSAGAATVRLQTNRGILWELVVDAAGNGFDVEKSAFPCRGCRGPGQS
jgi:beta-fructofuranosidase